ncbi:uncharacterized protein LOC124926324 [Impatiens glandulifera]|uniref:uncharacterized protein LOC124926324 n=1 Tax=Impatiens glandulifera TaxID=253017 RepID=UPI001FB13AEC|nr:uncharacterized protein LOC124926324 [Impatiens glandulifera]
MKKFTNILAPKYFIPSLLLSGVVILLFSLSSSSQKQSPTTTGAGEQQQQNNRPVLNSDLRIRPGYKTYDAYIQRQLNKTLNPKLRQVWTTRDWDRKINVFSKFFSQLKDHRLLQNSSRALCIGARVGQEVEALKRVGVSNSVGIDLVPYPPLVIRGDFHNQPFGNDTFEFEFSNVFDHALYPEKFIGEIERTLKPGGICVIHVSLSKRADKYSANDLYSVEPLKALFQRSELVRTRKIDGFGLDTEVVFRKKGNSELIKRF